MGEFVSLCKKNYVSMWKNIFNFKGRATRQEYWVGIGLAFISIYAVCCITIIFYPLLISLPKNNVTLILLIIYAIISFASSVFMMALILACFSLKVRRFHDVGKSFWWIFICYALSFIVVGTVLNLVYLCSDSKEDNKWGANLKTKHLRISDRIVLK